MARHPNRPLDGDLFYPSLVVDSLPSAIPCSSSPTSPHQSVHLPRAPSTAPAQIPTVCRSTWVTLFVAMEAISSLDCNRQQSGDDVANHSLAAGLWDPLETVYPQY